MHAGDSAADGPRDGDTEPLHIIDRPPEAPRDAPLRPLTDLAFDFDRTSRSFRPRTRLALPGAVPKLVSKRAAIGAALVVAVVAIAASWLWPRGPAPSAPPPAADDAAQLRTLVPASLSASCQPEVAASPAVSQLKCINEHDPSGPASARFMLSEDADDLPELLRRSVEDAQIVLCPNNMQSPGPWRRNAAPSEIAGTLVCAVHGNRSLIAWSTAAHNLVSVAEGDAQGPSLTQLYTWWTVNS